MRIDLRVIYNRLGPSRICVFSLQSSVQSLGLSIDITKFCPTHQYLAKPCIPYLSTMETKHLEVGNATHEEESSISINLDELSYGPPGFRGIFSSSYVALCAAFATIGGLLFGYDQGVMSVTLVMDSFLNTFPEVSDSASGSGFYKGLMTAMITLGAFIGTWSIPGPEGPVRIF